ncbi:helix-turn-helix domain-containing protein [Pseudomonas aeruginosa]|nr:helix-turn-helix domain-containing protein [Pseudomonas aeruginosa]MDA3297938.1 helix-turn-helix domain-containing protein [Pseudomonas aeruginosa]RPY30482.1 hypothetical protein IPC693_29490 [Pseudomonas aeruginosa]
MSADPWVTAEDVAQHLGVAKDTVYRWRERKGLPSRPQRDRLKPSFITGICTQER